MFNRLKIYMIVSLVLASIISCSRKTDVVGPDICPSNNFGFTSNFVVDDPALTTNVGEVNLLTSYAKISASFNETINWEVKVIGLTSGATTKYSGFSNTVDLKWYGEPNTSIFYQKGEKVKIEFYAACSKEPKASSELKITTDISLSKFGAVVANFDDVSDIGGPYAKDPANPPIISLISNADANYTSSFQGGKYLNFKCDLTPTQSEWYFGGMYFNNIKAVVANLPTDPTIVYLNIQVKGAPNSQAQFIFREKIPGVTDLQKRSYLINATEKWKNNYIKLSDIGVINPKALENFDLNLGASTTKSNSASVDTDLIIFTVGQPLIQ
jgi:hypothetical protein